MFSITLRYLEEGGWMDESVNSILWLLCVDGAVPVPLGGPN